MWVNEIKKRQYLWTGIAMMLVSAYLLIPGEFHVPAGFVSYSQRLGASAVCAFMGIVNLIRHSRDTKSRK